MRLPIQANAVARGTSVSRMSRAVEASGCDIFKKAACAAAIFACGTVCFSGVGTAACAQCLAGIGASGCIDCF